MKKMIIIIFIIILTGIVKPLPITQTLTRSDLIISIDREHTQFNTIKISNYTNSRGIAGAPSLPYVSYNMIIPLNTEISNFNITGINSEIISNIVPIPEQRDHIHQINGSEDEFTVPNEDYYNGNTSFPSQIAEVVEYNYIAGNIKVATIRVNPVAWNSINEELTFYNSFTINYELETVTDELMFSIEKNVFFRKDLQIYKDYIKHTTFNYNQYSFLFDDITIIDEPRDENDFNYLIIVPDEYSNPELYRPFKEWKEAKGNYVKVMSVSSIPTGGDHILHDIDPEFNIILDNGPSDLFNYNRAPSLRQYLFEHFVDYGLTYVLIVGEDKNSPHMFGYTISNTYGTNARNNQTVTDLYLADFNGDWNVDGEEREEEGDDTTPLIYRHGERDDDDIDRFAEIFIGRILIPEAPLNLENEIENWIEKVITHEKNPGYGNSDYVKDYYFHETDQAITYLPAFKNMLSSSYGMNCTGIEETTGATAVNNMENKGMIHGDWHGSFNNVATKRVYPPNSNNYMQNSVFYNDEYQTLWSQSVIEDNNGFDSFEANKGMYSIMIECGCITCNYAIQYGTDDPENPSNYIPWERADTSPKLPRVFISKFEKKGGVAWIGNTSGATNEPMNFFRERFFASIFSDDFNDLSRNIGLGFAVGKNYAQIGDHEMILGLTLFGDPEMNVWKNIPKSIELEAITSNSIKFTAEDGSSLSDALVRLKTVDGWIETSPDENNIVTSEEDFSEIALFKDGYLPTTAKVIENSLDFSGSNNTIWQNLIVKGSLNLAAKSVLKIVPGSSITLVEGGLINASGTGSDRAILTCNVEGQTWEGIKVIGSQTKSKYLENLIIKNAVTAIDVQFPRLELKSIEIMNSIDGINAINSAVSLENVIINTEHHGVKFTGCTGSIFQSSINDCKYGVTSISSNVKFRENYITNNSYYGIFVDGRDSYIDLGKNISESSNPTGNKIYNNGTNLNSGPKGQILIGDLGQINLYKGKNDIHSIFLGTQPDMPNLNLLQHGEEPLERNIIVAWYNYWGKPTGASISTPTSDYFYPTNTSGWLDFSNFATEEYFLSPAQATPDEIESFEMLIVADQEIENSEYVVAEASLREVITDYPNTEAAYGSICKLFELHKIAELDMNLYLNYLNSFSPTETISDKSINELKLRVYLFQNDKEQTENQLLILSAGDETELERILTAIDATITESLVEDRNLPFAATVIDRKVIKKKVKKILDLYKIGSSREENQLIANSFELLQNYPNPFNPSTTIKFALPTEKIVKLQIFNVKGELIQTLINNKNIQAGLHKINFDGSRLSTGVYYYSIKAGDFKNIKKMMLIK